RCGLKWLRGHPASGTRCGRGAHGAPPCQATCRPHRCWFGAGRAGYSSYQKEHPPVPCLPPCVDVRNFAPSNLANGPRPAGRLWPAGVARVANDVMNHEPVPDEQHYERADRSGDETSTLIKPVPADALADEGGEEGTGES